MDQNTAKHANLKKSFVALAGITMIGFSGSLFAAVASGQLVVVNSLGVSGSNGLGASASSIQVQVNDSTGVCSTSTVAYGGVTTVTWATANTHSASKCTNIVSVDVTAIKTNSGVVQYDSTANATPPAVATAATTFTAPTTANANLTLVVTGNASAATTGSATVWGSALGVAPVYATTNGSLSTTGIMGSVGVTGLKAATIMLKYGILPVGQVAYSAE
ncbi:MAG: hypothetical protein PSV35_00445 [bacterium]|nr:hypothetical protein [bacterium]